MKKTGIKLKLASLGRCIKKLRGEIQIKTYSYRIWTSAFVQIASVIAEM